MDGSASKTDSLVVGLVFKIIGSEIPGFLHRLEVLDTSTSMESIIETDGSDKKEYEGRLILRLGGVRTQGVLWRDSSPPNRRISFEVGGRLMLGGDNSFRSTDIEGTNVLVAGVGTGIEATTSSNEMDPMEGNKTFSFRVDVDYDVPVEELVRRGEFQWVAEEWHTSRFTSANYPVAKRGRTQVELALVSCKGVSIQEGLERLDSTKYRPGTLHELLAFAAAHPMLQKEFRIVAPGTQVPPRPDHPMAAPELAWGGLGRILNLVSMSWNQGGSQWMLLAARRV